ncbi:MAG: hypothetical protein ACQES4_02220, partial [Bacillota bacterium]
MKKRTIHGNLFNRSIAFKDNVSLQKLLLTVALFLVIYGLLVIVSIPARYDLTVGRPSPRTIYAPRDFIDEYSTEQLREEAAEAVPEVYDYNPAVLERALREIGIFFDKVIDIKNNPDLDTDQKVNVLMQDIPGDLPRSTVEDLVAAEKDTIRDLQGRLNNTVQNEFEEGIKENETDSAMRHISQGIALYPFSSSLKRVAEAVIEPYIA